MDSLTVLILIIPLFHESLDVKIILMKRRVLVNDQQTLYIIEHGKHLFSGSLCDIRRHAGESASDQAVINCRVRLSAIITADPLFLSENVILQTFYIIREAAAPSVPPFS